MKELLIIPMLAVTLYLLFVYRKYGMTISISATYKVVTGFEKMWFSATLWAVAIPIIIVSLDGIADHKVKVLFFLAGALICLVAASPGYWTSQHELTAHLIGSYGGISIGMIACLVHFYSSLTAVLIAIFVLFTAIQFFNIKNLRINNYIYWIEVAAILTVCLVLWFQ